MSSPPAVRPPIHLPGMPFLNRLLGGGLPAGKLIGLVGPTGKGKTLLAMQISYALATAGSRVLYMGVETGNAFGERLAKLMTDDASDEEGRSAILTKLAPNLIFAGIKLTLAIFTDINTPKHIAGLQSTLSGLGIPPDLIVIDQLGPWIRGHGDPLIKETIEQYCAELKEFAERSGLPVLLLHQLKGGLTSSSAIRLPEVTDAMESRVFGSSAVDIGLFIGTQDSQQLCWISHPAADQHELVWMDGDNQRFRSMGSPGEFFDVDPRRGQFSLTANALRLRLSTPAGVSRHLDGPRRCDSASASVPPLNWQALYAHYQPEITAFYKELYTSERNTFCKLKRQTAYRPCPRRYGPPFWDDVFQEHYTHRFSFQGTHAFLTCITGSHSPWPDMLRRLPGLLRAHSDLPERYYSHLADHPLDSPQGAFQPCSTAEQISACVAAAEGGLHLDNATLLWCHMMRPDAWSLLTDQAEVRAAIACTLDLLLEQNGMEELEQKLAPFIAAFFEHIATLQPRDPPPGI